MLDIGKFFKDGWVVIDIPNPNIIHDVIDRLNLNMATIENHQSLSERFWGQEFSLEIGHDILPIIQQLIGLDVMVQYFPYLRIARPGKPRDNIGYHKDTQYGQNPYEIAVHIPFVDLDEKSAIRVISGSHLMPESVFPRITADGIPIEKGSIENKMGRPYMPKCLAIPEGMETTPLCMKVGQAALFSPAIFHGQEVNEGGITRVSCDLRFINSHAPVEIRQGKTHAGYVPISQSPVEKIAEKYYASQVV